MNWLSLFLSSSKFVIVVYAGCPKVTSPFWRVIFFPLQIFNVTMWVWVCQLFKSNLYAKFSIVIILEKFRCSGGNTVYLYLLQCMFIHLFRGPITMYSFVYLLQYIHICIYCLYYLLRICPWNGLEYLCLNYLLLNLAGQVEMIETVYLYFVS